MMHENLNNLLWKMVAAALIAIAVNSLSTVYAEDSVPDAQRIQLLERKSNEAFDQSRKYVDSGLQKYALRSALLYALQALHEAPMGKTLDKQTLIRFSGIDFDGLTLQQTPTPALDLRSSISVLTYSPDGGVIASGLQDGTMQLWNASRGEFLHSLQGRHEFGVSALVYSPDGVVLASSGLWDNTVSLWDVKTGKLLVTLKGHESGVNVLAYSPNGRVIASGSDDKTVRLWDARTGKTLKILKGHTDGIRHIAYSPDGRVIASEAGFFDNDVYLWDAESGKSLEVLKKEDPEASENFGYTLKSFSYNAEGHLILFLSSVASNLHLQNSRTREVLRTFEEKFSLYSLAISSDGKLAAAGADDNKVRLWNTDDNKEAKILNGQSGKINAIAFSPDGNVLATGSSSNTIRFWNTHTGKMLNVTENLDAELASEFSPGGAVVATALSESTVRLENSETGETNYVLRGHNKDVSSVAYSPDGDFLASASHDRTIRLWDADTGGLIWATSNRGHDKRINALAYSPDGKVIASGAADNHISFWDAKTGKQLWSQFVDSYAHDYDMNDPVERSFWDDYGRGSWITPDPINALAYSPDGSVLASSSDDSHVTLWDAEKGKIIRTLKGHKLPVITLAYSPDGRVIASGAQDGIVRLWDAQTGKLLKIMEGHADSVVSLSFSSGSDGVVASGSRDGTIRLWNIQTGDVLSVFDESYGSAEALVYSPDGTLLVSGTYDGGVLLWDVMTGKDPKLLNGHHGCISSLAFKSDGSAIASGSCDKTVRLWEVSGGDMAEKAGMYHNAPNSAMLTKRLLNDFDPADVSGALMFLWNMRLDGLKVVTSEPAPSLYPQQGYYISWDDKNAKYRPLLDAPRPGETKIGQLIRWLEGRDESGKQ